MARGCAQLRRGSAFNGQVTENTGDSRSETDSFDTANCTAGWVCPKLAQPPRRAVSPRTGPADLRRRHFSEVKTALFKAQQLRPRRWRGNIVASAHSISRNHAPSGWRRRRPTLDLFSF